MLVSGASASGKSQFAETVCKQLAKKPLYIATMQPFGKEAEARIARHRLLRNGKGFDTLEQYTNIGAMFPQEQYDAALLECMGNLLANELYSACTQPQQVVQKICDGIACLRQRFCHLVIVSNDIGFDGAAYSAQTLAYMELLGQLNCALAKEAHYVVEVVSGIPVYHKGERRW